MFLVGKRHGTRPGPRPIHHADVSVSVGDAMDVQLSNLPSVCANLKMSGAELHIIGRDQVTSDLPEWRFQKGKPLPEYNGLTIDQRTRGMGVYTGTRYV